MLLPSQQPPVHDPEEVRQAAEEILSRSEFGEPPRTLLQRIIEWIADRFGDRGPPAFEGTGPGSGGSSLLTLILLVVLVVLLVLVVRALLRQPSRRRSDADPEPAIDVSEHRSAAAWEREAVDHEAAGRWKDAVRCRFRALLEHLVDRRVLDEVPGRTTGELRVEVAARTPAAATAFAAAADVFDLAWYGDIDTGPEQLQALVAHSARVLEAAVLVPAGAPDRDPAGDDGR